MLHTTIEGQPPLTSDSGDVTAENIAAVQDFYAQQELSISRAQWLAEQLSHFVGQPVFIVVLLVFVAVWVVVNTVLHALQMPEFDRAPFPWLQGVVALNAVLISTVVLVRQNRLAKHAEQRADLDLKVMLLIEQKTAKLIDLIEELRRDLPDVRDRHDSGAAALQKALNPVLVTAALDQRRAASEAETAAPVEAAPPVDDRARR